MTAAELAGIIRTKPQWETLERLRLRYRNGPAIDLTYRHREVRDAQITQFFSPNQFNDVRLDEFGVGLSQTIKGEHWDKFLGASYQRIARRGLVEFLPDAREDINQMQGNLGVSRYVGQDKFNLEGVFVYQDIHPDLASPPFRDRFIYGGTVSYNIYRKLPFVRLPGLERFETRGVTLFAGAAQDIERYDRVDVTKDDLFGGISIKGIGPMDVTIQSTVFTSSVTGDPSQDNSQYRTDVTLLLRLLDEERTPGIPRTSILGLRPAFVHLVLSAKHDIALDGLKAYENYRVGTGLDAKFIVRGFHSEPAAPASPSEFRGATILCSARYDHQWFHHLRREIDQFSFSMGIGF